jgi:mannose/fructose/N-acetylgalactosamine-specific phosphotransferase system component IIB
MNPAKSEISESGMGHLEYKVPRITNVHTDNESRKLKANLIFSSDEYSKFKQMKAEELDIFLSNGT